MSKRPFFVRKPGGPPEATPTGAPETTPDHPLTEPDVATLKIVPAPKNGLDLLRTVKKGFETVAEVVAASSGISIYDWKDMARSLIENQEKLQWAWGLWWNCGTFEHGERKRIVEAKEWTGPSYQTLKNYGNVVKRFLLESTAPTYQYKAPPHALYSRYPFSYYEKLAPLDDEDVQYLLAEESYTTRAQLEAAIAKRTAQGKLPLTIQCGDPETSPKLSTESEKAARQISEEELIKQSKTPEMMEMDLAALGHPKCIDITPSTEESDPVEPLDSHRNAIDDLRQRLQERYQTEVDISLEKTGGKISFRYYSDDDLNRVLSLLGVSTI